MVEEEKPPRPLVSSHSRRWARSRSAQVAWSKRIMARVLYLWWELRARRKVTPDEAGSPLPGSASSHAGMTRITRDAPDAQILGVLRMTIEYKLGANGRGTHSGKAAAPGSVGGGEFFGVGGAGLALFAALLHEFGEQAGPSGLVAGADAAAVVAVEVFVEQDQVAPVGIGLELVEVAEYRAPAVAVAQEQIVQAAREFGGDLPQTHPLAGAGGEFYLEAVSQIVMEFLQGFDQQEVHREPDRAAPVGIASEQPGRRFAGFVVDAVVHAVDREHVGMLAVIAGEGADAVGREELVLVEHVFQDAAQLVLIDDGKQAAQAAAGRHHAGDVGRQVRAILDEPLEAALETRQALEEFGLQRLDRKQRDEADHGANLHGEVPAVGQAQDVIEEAVFLVPQAHAVVAAMTHGVGNVDEVLPELAGHVFVAGLFLGEFERDGEQVEGVHGHPAGAVRLLKVAAGGQGGAAVKHADVVEAEKSALENVHALGVLAVHPPGKVEQELVEDALQEGAVAFAFSFLVDLIDAPGGPGVNGGIHVAESPLVGGQLAVGMHVPLAQKKDELVLGEIGVHERQRNAMKSQVPGGIPGVLPLVGHGDDVGVVKMSPLVVASVLAPGGRRRVAGVAVQPVFHHVVIELLGPEQACETLAHHVLGVGGEFRRDHGGIEFVGFLQAPGDDGFEVAKGVVLLEAGVGQTQTNDP